MYTEEPGNISGEETPEEKGTIDNFLSSPTVLAGTEFVDEKEVHEDAIDEKDDDEVAIIIEPEEEKSFLSYLCLFKCSMLTYEFFVLMLAYMCDGIINSMFSPIMVELSHMVNVSEEDIGWIVTSRNVGRIVSAPIAIILYEVLKRLWFCCSPMVRLLQICFVLMLVCVGLVPVFTYFWFIVFDYFLIGFFFEMIEIGINVEACEVYSVGVNVVLQILHGSYALGTCLFPLITTQILKIGNDNAEVDILYILCAIFLFISFVLMSCICIFPNRKKKKDDGEDEQEEQDRQEDEIKEEEKELVEAREIEGEIIEVGEEEKDVSEKIKSVEKVDSRSKKCVLSTITIIKHLWVYILAAGIKGVSVGVYDTYGPMIDVFAKNTELSKNEDAISYMVFCFWFFLALGRLSSALVVKCCPNVFLLTTIHTFALCVFFVILWIFCDYLWVVWIMTCVVGFTVGPLSPYAVGIGKSYFDVPIGPVSVGLCYIGSNLGAILISSIVNSFEHMYDKFLFPACLGICIVGLFILFIVFLTKIFYFYACGISKKKKKKKKKKGKLASCFSRMKEVGIFVEDRIREFLGRSRHKKVLEEIGEEWKDEHLEEILQDVSKETSSDESLLEDNI